MNRSCKQVAASNVEIYELLYQMHITKDTFFFSEQFSETLLISIAANIALTKKISDAIDHNETIVFKTSSN